MSTNIDENINYITERINYITNKINIKRNFISTDKFNLLIKIKNSINSMFNGLTTLKQILPVEYVSLIQNNFVDLKDIIDLFISKIESKILVDCKLSDIWNDWSLCTALCNGGTQFRTKKIITEPTPGGIQCNELPNYIDSQTCNEQSCNDFESGVVILRMKD